MIGTTISHYKILEKLGEGGMGVVYKAEDTKLERMVALKFLSPQTLGTEEEKIRFVREAKAAAALAHPSICNIYEIDEAGDQTFIAMECIGGSNLSKRIEAGPLDIDEAVNIALRVAEGLKHAHKRGIIHRDIKPANIMLTEDGQAKIMDFGLAKLSGRTRLTKTATVMGTIAYMSPEQARGDKDIGHQTDLWSLGVVLYEMLTGVLPFDAETDTGLIYKIVHEHPEPIGNHRSDIPGSLASAVERSMQKNPQNRHKDAEKLITDLEAVKSGASLSTSKSSPSIVVLPFINMSADPEQEYFCDGLAEDLINALTQLQDVHVIARTSAFSFKNKNVKVQEIGKELNVATALEGSVRRAGNRLRITAQLVETAEGHHLWSEQYNREMDDIFAIQDEITQAIVGRLKPKLLAGEEKKLAKRNTVDLEPYNLYLKGRYFFNKVTEEGFRKATEYFERAIKMDPDYALAYAGLADAYISIPINTPLSSKVFFEKGKELALKALEIDEELGEAHASLGYINTAFDWDWKGAEKEFKRAIELNPGHALAHHWYALYLGIMERFEESIREAHLALELDPLSLVMNRIVGMVLAMAGQSDRAIEMLNKTVEMDPFFSNVHLTLGFVYSQESMYKKALVEYEKEIEASGGWNPAAQCAMGWTYAQIGEKDKAREVLNSLTTQLEEESLPYASLADLYFALDEDDKAFECLEKAFQERDPWLSFIKIRPTHEIHSLLADPRFIALLKKMNLEP